MGAGSLGEMFQPLEHADFSGLYTSYAVVIDLAVYLLVFIGIAQVTLGKRFQGSGGKAITIGIGVSLAVSLAIVEQYLGFSLRSLGPIAAGLFLAIVAVMMFRLVKHFGGGTAVSGSIAYVFVLLSIVAAVPGFFAWVNRTIPLINLGLLIGLLVAGYTIVAHFLRKKGIPEKYAPVIHKEKEEFKTMPAELSESKKYQRNEVKPITKRAYRESRNVLEELKRLVPLVEKYGHLPEARKDIRMKLEKILPRQLEVVQYLTRLQVLHKRIRESDWSVYSASVRGQLGRLDGPAKTSMKNELIDEYVKLGIEKRLSEIEQRIQVYQTELRRCLEEAGGILTNGDTNGVVGILKRAVSYEEQSMNMIEGLRSLEKEILKHTKREIALDEKTGMLSRVRVCQ